MEARIIKPFTPNTVPKVAIVSDCPAVGDFKYGTPLHGGTGDLLTQLLIEADIVREDCYITTVFKENPPNGQFAAWCTKKKEAEIAWKQYRLQNFALPICEANAKYPYKAIGSAQYLDPKRATEAREALYRELEDCGANIVIALGATAVWALLDGTGIAKVRGTMCTSPYIKQKVLPVYHPAAILKNYDQKVIALVDLMKANREQHFPELIIPNVEVWVAETIQDILDFEYVHMRFGEDSDEQPPKFSFDIETAHQHVEYPQITCLGCSVNDKYALVVPIVDRRKDKDWNYWEKAEDEVAVFNWFAAKLADKGLTKIMQNGMYDMSWMWRYGMPTYNSTADTMYGHHSMYSEMEKSLGFLASVYTNFPSWKHMRPRGTLSDKAGE